MALSDMVVFDSFVYRAYTETVQQQVEKFNDASDNSLRLVAGDNVGDFSHQAIYSEIENLVRYRNAYGNADVAMLNLGQKDIASVKVAGGVGPVSLNPVQFSWVQRNQEEGAIALAEQLAKATMRQKLNTAIGAGYAALVQNANVVTDVTASPTDNKCSLRNLALAQGKFGDSSDRIRSWVMHSVPANDLLLGAIANGSHLFSIDNVARVYQDAQGRPIIVTDSPFLLTTAGTPAVTKYHVLGLVEDAIRVEDNGDFAYNMEYRNGKENLLASYQAEWTYNVQVRGYSWDPANGSKSPTIAALTTSTNWDKYSTSDKDVAGVVLEVL